MSAAPSVCLVLNGKAAMREDVRAAVHAVRDEGHRVEVRVTWEGGDATRFARQAAEAGFEVVVAGGGDYLLPVKDNQPTLHADLAAAVSPLAGDGA